VTVRGSPQFQGMRCYWGSACHGAGRSQEACRDPRGQRCDDLAQGQGTSGASRGGVISPDWRLLNVVYGGFSPCALKICKPKKTGVGPVFLPKGLLSY